MDLVEHAEYMGTHLKMIKYYLGYQNDNYCLQYVLSRNWRIIRDHIGNEDYYFTPPIHPNEPGDNPWVGFRKKIYEI